MHRRGVLHGTVRPSRILLSRTGHVKVGGYGLSHVRPPFKSQVKGDPTYTAPEVAKKGNVDEQSDIYGLAATMYQVLTRRPPMRQGGQDEDHRIARPASVNPKIPAPVSDLLMNCLRRHPERRPPDMYEVVKQLEEMVKASRLTDEDLAGITTAAAVAVSKPAPEPESEIELDAEEDSEPETYEV
jgi:serine/threonine protein kinase